MRNFWSLFCYVLANQACAYAIYCLSIHYCSCPFRLGSDPSLYAVEPLKFFPQAPWLLPHMLPIFMAQSSYCAPFVLLTIGESTFLLSGTAAPATAGCPRVKVRPGRGHDKLLTIVTQFFLFRISKNNVLIWIN